MDPAEPTLERILAESELSSLAFTIIKRFSTQKPLNELLTDLFCTIGCSIRLWCKAQIVTHVFVNPSFQNFNQSHRMFCAIDDNYLANCDYVCKKYEELNLGIEPPRYGPHKPLTVPSPNRLADVKDDDLIKISLPDDIIKNHNGEVWVTQLDFSNQLQLGHFCVAWLQEPKMTPVDANHIQSVLWNLSGAIARILNNNFSIHKNTYLPSYAKEGPKPAAILFADIRNSTPLFEIARLGGREHILRVEAFLKAWLQYSADLIMVTGIGHIYRFAGDGFMATFGEYIVESERCSADVAACILAIYGAKQLVEAFNKLHQTWLEHKNVKQFYLDNNEFVDLRLGVGINYGNINFSYFGVPCFPEPRDYTTEPEMRPGCLDFMAVGDHVNTAERLEGIASKLLQDVDLRYRGPKYADQFYLTPIVASQTVARRLSQILDEKEDDVLNRRGMVYLKGKSLGLPFYEINPDEISALDCATKISGIAVDHHSNVLKNPPNILDYTAWLNKELSL